MKLAFMTLGCPGWDLETICRRGEEYGFQGVDFRGLKDELDITVTPEFTTDLAKTQRKLADAGLEVSGISSSLRVCDPNALETNLEEARRTVPLAAELGARFVRVFGGGPVEELGREACAEAGRECLRRLLELDGAEKVIFVFETHDHWIRSEEAKMLLDHIDSPNFGALWDMAHTARVAKQSPEETYAAIGDKVRYCHVKDAKVADDGSFRYVTPGEGDLQVERACRLLIDGGYDGWWLFEHEKRWIPDLDEPEVIFPGFVKWARQALA